MSSSNRNKHKNKNKNPKRIKGSRKTVGNSSGGKKRKNVENPMEQIYNKNKQTFIHVGRHKGANMYSIM